MLHTQNAIRLGQGAFGKVLKVKHRGTGELYALKVIQPEPRREIDETDPIRRELRVMSGLIHVCP